MTDFGCTVMLDKQTKLDQLIAERAAIVQLCAGWKKCQDGSYEMALDAAGFYDVIEQIKQLSAELDNQT